MSLSRKGRPPAVKTLDDGTIQTKVKGQVYEFYRDSKGNLRPKNTKAGVAEDRDYAKKVVQRSLAN